MNDFKKEPEDYFCRFTFGQFVSLLLMELVILIAVFYLGSQFGPEIMGKGTPEVAEIQPPENREESGSEKNGTPEVKESKQTDLTFPEVLTKSGPEKSLVIKPSGVSVREMDVKKEDENLLLSVKPTAVPIKRSEAPEREGTQIINGIEGPEILEKPQPSPPEKKVVVEKTGPVPPTPLETFPAEATDTVEPAPKAVSKSYSIQVGSFQSSAEAEMVVKKWTKKGYQAFISKGEIPNRGVWHRVRIGEFDNRDQAQNYMKFFSSKEKTPALIVISRK